MVGIDGDDAVGTLHNGEVQVLLLEAHHGAAGLDGHVFALDTAAGFHQVSGVGADLDQEVVGVGDEGTGDGGNALDQGACPSEWRRK